MIILVKRSNVFLLGLVLLLILAVFSLNANGEESTTVTANIVNKTIVVDAGHGGEDPGAVSDYSGLREKDISLVIANELKSLLEEQGCSVIMTRTEDILQYPDGTKGVSKKRHHDLSTRKKLIDESDADIAVSIHLNKFPQTQYYGAQTFYPPNSPESKKLAECLQDSLREGLDTENKREAQLKKEPIILFKGATKTTVMVECGFLSNKNEENKLADPQYQKKIAEAIRDGINAYFNN